MIQASSSEILTSELGEQLPQDQRIFVEELEAVRKSDIRPMPGFSQVLNHSGQLTNFDISNLQPGFYADEAYLPDTHNNGMPDRLGFSAMRMMQIGRDDSRHEVFFGALVMNWFKHGEVAQRQVAIKPSIPKSPADVNLALQEVAMNQYLGELGVPALQVAGLLVGRQYGAIDAPSTFEVTLFRPDVTTMDNINWQGMTMEERWRQLGIALDTLADLHSHLVFHGDPDLRNIAFGEKVGDTVVVDTEFSESGLHLVHPSSTQGEQRIYQCMSNDFSRLSMSVDKHIFGNLPRDERPTAEQRFEELLEHMYIPYYERLLRTGSPYLKVLTRQLDEIMNRKMREALGEV